MTGPVAFRALAFRFLAHRGGAAALEFALVLLPFVALSLAIIETAVMMFTSSVVQGGIVTAARQIRTGQITSGTVGSCPNGTQAASIPAAFSNAVCSSVLGQISCSNLTYDVQSYGSFAAANTPWTPSFSNGSPTNNCFDTGGPNAVVAIRVAYNYDFLTPGLSALLGGTASQGVAFVYTVIVENEPF